MPEQGGLNLESILGFLGNKSTKPEEVQPGYKVNNNSLSTWIAAILVLVIFVAVVFVMIKAN